MAAVESVTKFSVASLTKKGKRKGGRTEITNARSIVAYLTHCLVGNVASKTYTFAQDIFHRHRTTMLYYLDKVSAAIQTHDPYNPIFRVLTEVCKKLEVDVNEVERKHQALRKIMSETWGRRKTG